MIPVYVNVFNRLTTTRRLCEQVASLDDCTPIIVDNASTWGPLLDWYANCPYEVIRLEHNMGHHAPWRSGAVLNTSSEFYIVTDCDIDIDGVPKDVASILQIPFQWSKPEWSLLQSDYYVIKSGLSLRIDDVPETQDQVLRWERQFWEHVVECDPRFFWAPIDTTFAMYHRSTWHKRAMKTGATCVRLGGEYQARHMPWYDKRDSLDAETLNYYHTAGRSNTWRPSVAGMRPARRGRVLQ
jgi:hypothetical protein